MISPRHELWLKVEVFTRVRSKMQSNGPAPGVVVASRSSAAIRRDERDVKAHEDDLPVCADFDVEHYAILFA